MSMELELQSEYTIPANFRSTPSYPNFEAHDCLFVEMFCHFSRLMYGALWKYRRCDFVELRI